MERLSTKHRRQTHSLGLKDWPFQASKDFLVSFEAMVTSKECMLDGRSPVKIAVQPAPMGKEEVRLRERVLSRHPEAFDEIVREYHDRVRRLTERLLGWTPDVEDVVQEVFVGVLVNLGKFRGESSLSTWIATITVNACRSHQRRLRMTAKLQSLLRWRQWSMRAEPAGNRTRDDVADQVRAAVRRLPMRLREAVALCYLEELSTAEAGAILGITAGAVQVRLHRGREMLKETLAGLESMPNPSRENDSK